MTFSFDVEKVRKRTPTPANPAKAANPDRIPEQISGISEVSSTPQADRADFEERREKVLALLRATAGARLAVLVEDGTSDPVSLAIALRNTNGVSTFEMHIPRDRYDGIELLALVEKHASREIAVIVGKTHRVPEAA